MTSDANENTSPKPDPVPDTGNLDATPEATPATTPEPAPAPEAESAASPPTAEEPRPEPPPEESPEAEAGDGEFAAMLEESSQADPVEAKPGDEVKGRIVQIGEQDAFVDCGLRNELPISLTQLTDAKGDMPYKEGDEIKAYVQKDGDALKLTLAVNARDAGREALAAAFQAGTPVQGKVGETNKGGFSVDLGGVRAFCPFSQIDLRRADDPAVFVGKDFEFKILEYAEGGKNIVVSRRALLQAQREEQATETRNSLAMGDTREGIVTRLVPFGAFVDIGGVEGLVHISQISHQRVGHPGDVLKENEQVKVKVLEIQNLGQGRSERISLSMKALASDPWPETASSLAPGNDVSGRVTRLVDFGVFVELLPGIEGLVHISELANRRIIHPREVLNEDDQIEVRVLDVDLDRRRISLSLRQAANYDGE